MVAVVVSHDSMNEIICFIKLNIPLFSPQLTLLCFSCTRPLLEYCLPLNICIVFFFSLTLNTLGARWLRLTSRSLHKSLRGNISTNDCARKLFKPLKDSTSLCVCNEKKTFFLVLGFRFFVSDVISGIVSGLFGQLHLALGPNC